MMLPFRKNKHSVEARNDNVRVNLKYDGRRADEMAQLEAQQFADAADKLAREQRIFHHGFRKLFAVRSWHATYQRMSRIPDEDDRGGLVVKKFKNRTIWIGFSTRTDLWLISFWKKETK